MSIRPPLPLTIILAFAAMAAHSGCRRGPTTYPVSGVVTLDGQPVEGAAVMFSPQDHGRPATGRTDASGRFELATFVPGDGAVPGRHWVTVSLLRVNGTPGMEVAPTGDHIQWIVPQRYSDRTRSGLEIEVKRSMTPVSLDLSSS